MCTSNDLQVLRRNRTPKRGACAYAHHPPSATPPYNTYSLVGHRGSAFCSASAYLGGREGLRRRLHATCDRHARCHPTPSKSTITSACQPIQEERFTLHAHRTKHSSKANRGGVVHLLFSSYRPDPCNMIGTTLGQTCNEDMQPLRTPTHLSTPPHTTNRRTSTHPSRRCYAFTCCS